MRGHTSGSDRKTSGQKVLFDASSKPYPGKPLFCCVAPSNRHSLRQASYAGGISVRFFVAQWPTLSCHEPVSDRWPALPWSSLLWPWFPLSACSPSNRTHLAASAATLGSWSTHLSFGPGPNVVAPAPVRGCLLFPPALVSCWNEHLSVAAARILQLHLIRSWLPCSDR